MGAGDDAGDTGRNRMTADVTHVYFYSVSQSLWKRITAKQTRYTSPVSYQQIRSVQVHCKRLPCFVGLHENLHKTKHTLLRSATKKGTQNHQTQIFRIYTLSEEELVVATLKLL